MYLADSGRTYSIGVISGGDGCASSKGGLNTRVTSQLDWIEANTYSELFCKL